MYSNRKVKWVRVLDMQVTLHDRRIVMQVTLHYELASVVEFARSSQLFHGLFLVLNEMRRFGKMIDNDPDGHVRLML
nr:hypothetical protein [Tanacetum cinerariifolium]